MKRILVLFFIFSPIFSFSQDSLKEKKNSFGVAFMPFEFIRWHLPEANPYWYKDSESEKTIFITNTSPLGINYQYMLNNSFKVQIGVSYSSERFNFTYGGKIATYTQYKLNHFDVPFSIRFFPEHLAQKDALGGLFVQVGACLEFRTVENIKSRRYTNLTPSSMGAYNPNWVDPNYKIDEYNSNKLKLNRICPTIGIGQEIVGNSFTFFYSCNLKLVSIYREKNELFSVENVKFSFLNGGVSYRF